MHLKCITYNYSFLDGDWFKNSFFYTNSLAKFSFYRTVCYGTDELFKGQFVIRQFNTPTTLKLQLKSTNHIHFDCGQCQSDITQCTPPLRLLIQIYFPFLSYLGYSSFHGNCNFHA